MMHSPHSRFICMLLISLSASTARNHKAYSESVRGGAIGDLTYSQCRENPLLSEQNVNIFSSELRSEYNQTLLSGTGALREINSTVCPHLNGRHMRVCDTTRASSSDLK